MSRIEQFRRVRSVCPRASGQQEQPRRVRRQEACIQLAQRQASPQQIGGASSSRDVEEGGERRAAEVGLRVEDARELLREGKAEAEGGDGSPLAMARADYQDDPRGAQPLGDEPAQPVKLIGVARQQTRGRKKIGAGIALW